MDVSNLLCLSVVRSFWSSICVVFLSYWRDLSKHVVLDLMSSSFFVCLFCFVIIWWVWETYCIVGYCGCERPAIPCHYFFRCPVLFYLSFLFCHNMTGVRDLSYCRVWWLWETCHTMSFFFLRWVPFVFLHFLYWPLYFYSIVLFAISSLNIYIYIYICKCSQTA